MYAAMLICDFGVKYQFLVVIIQHLSCMLEFTAVDPLAINEFLDLCAELDGPFESHFCLPM